MTAGPVGTVMQPTRRSAPAKVADTEIDQRATACEPLVVREFLADPPRWSKAHGGI